MIKKETRDMEIITTATQNSRTKFVIIKFINSWNWPCFAFLFHLYTNGF